LGERLKCVKNMSRASIGGFPSGLLFAELYNIDAHQQLLMYHQDVIDKLVDRFYSTDDIEMYFSELVRGIGWKATWSVITGFLRNLDRLHALRRDPDSGLVLPADSGASYTYHQAIGKKAEDWRNPELLQLDTEASRRYYRGVMRAAISIVSQKMHVRDFHKYGALR
jgi:hypothetical protein